MGTGGGGKTGVGGVSRGDGVADLNVELAGQFQEGLEVPGETLPLARVAGDLRRGRPQVRNALGRLG